MKTWNIQFGKFGRASVTTHDGISDVAPSATYSKRPLMVVIPGGGYQRVSPREADPVAFRFLALGMNTVVVNHYPVKDEIKDEKPLDCLKTLMDMILSSPDTFGADPERIAMIGFSAGGHLAASYATIENGKGLKACVLAYPVITSGPFAHKGSFDYLCGDDEKERAFMSLEDRVTPATTPCYVFHAADDPGVPVENSLLFAGALSKNGVPFELHVFPSGGHGFSTGTVEVGTPVGRTASWVDECSKWLCKVLEFTP